MNETRLLIASFKDSARLFLFDCDRSPLNGFYLHPKPHPPGVRAGMKSSCLRSYFNVYKIDLQDHAKISAYWPRINSLLLQS